MSSRKVILGAVILFSCAFLIQCTKQNKQTDHSQTADIKKAVAAAQAGQFDKIDPKVMREVMQQYKQPTLPPLTTPTPAAQSAANSLNSGCGQCRTVLAQSQAPPVVAAPVQVTAPAPSTNTVVVQPPVASNPTPPPQEPVNSYIPPIEDKTPAAQGKN